MHHIFLWALSKMSPCAWSSHPMGFLMLSCCCCHQLWTAAALLRLCFLGTSVATLTEEVTETLPLTLPNILSSEPRERPGSEWGGFEGWSCILVTAIVLPDLCWAYNGCSFMGTVPSTREKTQSRHVSNGLLCSIMVVDSRATVLNFHHLQERWVLNQHPSWRSGCNLWSWLHIECMKDLHLLQCFSLGVPWFSQ